MTPDGVLEPIDIFQAGDTYYLLKKAMWYTMAPSNALIGETPAQAIAGWGNALGKEFRRPVTKSVPPESAGVFTTTKTIEELERLMTSLDPPKPRKARAPRIRKGIKGAALGGAKGIGGAFLDGAKGAGANESIKFLIAGLRRAGTWHPLLDTPNLAPVVEVVLPALLGITLGTFEGQVPYAGEASQFLLLAAQEPARKLGADAIHHFGTLARAVILQDAAALDGALKAMLPASTGASFTDFIPQGGEKECVASSGSSSSSSSSSSPPLAVGIPPTG